MVARSAAEWTDGVGDADQSQSDRIGAGNFTDGADHAAKALVETGIWRNPGWGCSQRTRSCWN